jgi:hypothetical protein
MFSVSLGELAGSVGGGLLDQNEKNIKRTVANWFFMDDPCSIGKGEVP